MKPHLLAEQQPSILDAVLCNPHEIRRLCQNNLLDIAQSHKSVELLCNQPWVNTVREHTQNLLTDHHNNVFNFVNLLNLHLELEVPQKCHFFATWIVIKLRNGILPQMPEQDKQLA